MICFQGQPFFTSQFLYEYVKRDCFMGVRGEKKEYRNSHRSSQKIIPNYLYRFLIPVFKIGLELNPSVQVGKDGKLPNLKV